MVANYESLLNSTCNLTRFNEKIGDLGSVVPLRKEYDTMRVVWNENNTEALNLKIAIIIWLEDTAGLLEMKDWEMLITQPK